MPYVKPCKAHWGPNVGRVVCGRKTKARRVKTREEWDALEKDDRCALCDEHVQRDGKPREKSWLTGRVFHEVRTMPLEQYGAVMGLPSATVSRALRRARQGA